VIIQEFYQWLWVIETRRRVSDKNFQRLAVKEMLGDREQLQRRSGSRPALEEAKELLPSARLKAKAQNFHPSR